MSRAKLKAFRREVEAILREAGFPDGMVAGYPDDKRGTLAKLTTLVRERDNALAVADRHAKLLESDGTGTVYIQGEKYRLVHVDTPHESAKDEHDCEQEMQRLSSFEMSVAALLDGVPSHMSNSDLIDRLNALVRERAKIAETLPQPTTTDPEYFPLPMRVESLVRSLKLVDGLATNQARCLIETRCVVKDINDRCEALASILSGVGGD